MSGRRSTADSERRDAGLDTSGIPGGTDGRPSGGTSEALSLAFLGDTGSVHFQRWVNYMAQRGDSVTVLVANGVEVAPGLHPSIAVERFESYARKRIWPLALLRARRSLRRVLNRVRPTVLNAHYMTVHGTNAWLSGFHPYVVTVWGSDVLVSPRKSRRLAVLARFTLRAADMVMVNSAAAERGAVRLGAPAERIEMVQWGVDLNRFAPGPDPAALRARLGLEGKRVVFSPRRIAPLYRQRVVLAAMENLPSDTVLLMTMFGADASELASVRRSIEDLSLGSRVVLVTEIADAEMPDHYRLADVMVSVPASDSTASTILEAMATGLPIVASDLPSVREWLGEVEPSLLVPVDDPVATAAAIAEALDLKRAERAALARRARSVVEDRADQSVSLARVEALYRKLAGRSAGGTGRAGGTGDTGGASDPGGVGGGAR